MDNRSLAIISNIRRSVEDEPGVVLEQIRGNSSDLSILLCGLRDNVCKVSDVVRRTRETIQFLQYSTRGQCPGKSWGILGETYVRDLRLNCAVVLRGRLAYGHEDLVQTCFLWCPGVHGGVVQSTVEPDAVAHKPEARCHIASITRSLAISHPTLFSLSALSFVIYDYILLLCGLRDQTLR